MCLSEYALRVLTRAHFHRVWVEYAYHGSWDLNDGIWNVGYICCKIKFFFLNGISLNLIFVQRFYI